MTSHFPGKLLESLWTVPGIILAYLLGSLPSSVWIGKAFYGVDVRAQGSKNPGATNTFRVLGKTAGSIVLTLDIAKGYLGASIPSILIYSRNLPPDHASEWSILFGLVAVLGHLFPVFLGFKGGKGVATLLGMVLALHPLAALVSIGVFVFTLFLSRYVSLSSMVASLTFPVLQLLVPALKPPSDMYIYFGGAVFVLVVVTHHENIKRLLNGQENKASVFRSGPDQSK